MAGWNVIAHGFRCHARNENLKMRKLPANGLQAREQLTKVLRSNFLGSGRIDHDQARVSPDASALPDLDHGENRGNLQAEAFALRHLAKRCVGATFHQKQARIPA